jgi:WD40 repeat protein
LLLRLEGHIKPITDIHFSHTGDRLLTSGSTDGTVRIWAFSRDYLRYDHIVLNVYDDDDGGNPSYFNLAVLPQNRRNKKLQLSSQVHNACWVSDDQHVVTLQTVHSSASSFSDSSADARSVPTSMKVWDSMMGDLIHIISPISQVETKLLVSHPNNPSIILTGSKGGMLVLWDISSEQELCKVYTSNELDQRPPDVLDAVFSSDGTRVVCRAR